MKKIILGILLTVVGIVLFLLIGLWAPFWKTPEIKDFEKIQNRVVNMMEDTDTNDRAMIIETNEQALKERIRLINQAKERIIISTFDLREGNSTNDLFAVLLKKAQEGVKIQFLLDGVSATLKVEGKDLFEEFMNLENVTMKIYNEVNVFAPWKLMGRMHDKYIIVDDMAYILGGRNTFDYFLGDYIAEGKSFDREVLIYNADGNSNSSLFELEAYFKEIWNSKYVSLFKGSTKNKRKEKVITFLENHYEKVKEDFSDTFLDYSYFNHTKETKGVHLLANPIHPYAKEPVVFTTLSELIKYSKNTIIHTPYAVMDEYMLKTLTELSKNTYIKILLNAVTNGDNVVASSDYLKNKNDILKTGMDLYEYSGGTSYHGKSLVIDKKYAIIGSYNYDLRSTYVDTELMLVVNSEEIASELENTMNQMERDAFHVLDNGEYDLKENQIIPVPSQKQKIIWKILGFFLEPFRILV